MKRKRLGKILIISVISVTVLYFGGGMAAAFIVNNAVFARHDEERVHLTKNRDDFALLTYREEFSFSLGNNELKGYYYQASPSLGTVIAVHGMNGYADGPDAQYQEWFLSKGYSVCSIDLTASGSSQGSSINGLHQSAHDVKAVYDYLLKNEKLEEKVVLCGHSWGGYGVAASLGLGVKADAVITFSAFDNPFDTMVNYSERYVGLLAKMSIPPFYIAQNMAYGEEVFRSASKALGHSPTKALIIHGEEDSAIPLKDISLLDKARGMENVQTITLPHIGHVYPWLSESSYLYYGELTATYETLRKKGDDAAMKEFLDSIDLERSSARNEALFQQISSFLDTL
ncbi:MAG: alpha/beta hydrolase [Bacilli bacterium]|nr:alpha/beta hydrolase [Bacilli bacterium]